MNTSILAETAVSRPPFAVQKKNFRVTVITDPTVLAASPEKYVDILLGTNSSPNASAVLSNFQFQGGVVMNAFMNHGATGKFSSTITMQCRAGTPAPQVLGLLGSGLTQFSFDLALDTSCTTNDWFTLWLCDRVGSWFPSTAVDRPGLFASVGWNTAGEFNSDGYAGNGVIDSRSDTGFRATVVAL